MIKREELVQTSEYWFETIQNEIFRQVAAYLKDKNINQTQFAEQLGVSKGYVSQVMKGEFNYTLKKLIELSLAVGKAPVIEFKQMDKYIEDETLRTEMLYRPVFKLEFGKNISPLLDSETSQNYTPTTKVFDLNLAAA